MPKNSKQQVNNTGEKFTEAEGLAKLRELVLKEQKEKGLKCPVTDEFLIRFLRARKGDPYWGLEAIQSYYKMRLTVPSIKEKLNPESARKFLTSGMFTLLKGRESRGCPVVYFKSGSWDVDDIGFEEFYMGLFLIAEELTSLEDTQLHGIVLIVDHKNLSMNSIRKAAGQMSLTNIKRIVNLFQGAYPARFKDSHIINHPFIFDMLYKVAKPFIREKLKRRLHEHGNKVENIQGFISPDILPKSLLGNVPDEECFSDDFLERIFSKQEHYEEMAGYGYV